MKILILDIETTPHLSWHWRRWNENIPPSFTVEESRVLCWAAKWYGKKKIHFAGEWQDGSLNMLTRMWSLMDEADVIIGYNSRRFDVKRLNADFLRAGLGQPSPFQQVDLLQQVKKHFAFSSNKLQSILLELGLEGKAETGGMTLWMDVMAGSREAKSAMKAYNKTDVVRTEELYDTIRGWIDPHPNWGLYVDDLGSDNPTCPNCGGHNMRRHKKRPTKVGLYQQWQCHDCGAYKRGRKNLKEGGTDNGVLA